ncbi:MAG TPA: N-formylglutamate amidohydrolase [Dongiaceae bacterium]|jgi:predicted N-formylglutamate amidohydrolase|nr:N-formylglutamate amidohydrolase [Dongiaceae bacterium]
MSLLTSEDPAPFCTRNLEGQGRFLLFCDHAGRAIPRRLGTLGLDDTHLERHIAWDIGIATFAERLSDLLDAPLFLARYSRLVIDCNRRLEDPSSIAQESDGIAVPGNRGLSADERRSRADEIFLPYHKALAQAIETRKRQGPLAVLSLHSFTPIMGGTRRPWEIGLLWNRDARLVAPLMDALSAQGVCVGDNQPYSGRDEHGYSMERHAETHDLPHCLIEVRQDLIARPEDARTWAERMAMILRDIYP